MELQTSGRTILVVDDDPHTVEIIRLRLTNDGYRVLVARDGEEALECARRERPDLIVLDLMLPRIDGLDVCHILREECESAVPIIMVTARSAEDDRIRGLAIGADDYLTKPFSPRELSARVTAVLRRANLGREGRMEVFRQGDLVVDVPRSEATKAGNALRLTPTEFGLLSTLIAEPDRAFTRAHLLHRVFGCAYDGMERTIDVHIANLRKKLEPDPAQPIYVITVYGVGYRFGGTRDRNGVRA